MSSPILDSAEQKGTQGQPNPEGSENASGQAGSKAETVTKEEIVVIQKELATLRKQVQSDKDRAVKRVSDKVDALEGDLRDILQAARKEGRSVEDLLVDMEKQEERETRELLRDLAKSYKRELPGSSESGISDTGVNISEVLRELELDESDPRVKVFASKPFKTADEAYREAARLVKSIVKQPSDADRSSEEARRRTFATSQEQLMQEYKEGSKNLRGQALINFKVQMRKKGLQIS